MGAFEGCNLIHMTGFRGHTPIMGSYGYELAFESEKLNHMTINRGSRSSWGGLSLLFGIKWVFDHILWFLLIFINQFWLFGHILVDIGPN